MKYFILKLLIASAFTNISDFTITQTPNTSYDLHLEGIRTQRKARLHDYNMARSEAKDSVLIAAGAYLETVIVDSLIPYWYGTEWDFNGYTNIPNKGEIACGYFVSTTLKHTGLNLNRYRMAQQSALSEIKTIENGDPSFSYRNMSLTNFISNCKAEVPDGLYIIRLDFHVGYFYKKGNDIRFIHSNYITDQVETENALESEALASSNSFYLGKVSRNKELIRKWLLNEEIKIHLDNP